MNDERRFVYPFQVPAAETTLAERGAPPRDHFCENTQEDKEGAVDQGRLRGNGETAERADVEPTPVERPGAAPEEREDWEL